MNINEIKKIRSRKVLVGGAAGIVLVALAAGGGAYALSSEDDRPIPAADRERAEQAALAETGGGTVTDTEMDDEESMYEVEVTLADGRQVDVHLDRGFVVVSTETDGPEDGADGADEADEADEADRTISDADRRRAEEAALAETGGGTVTSAEGDDRNGYEVEVTQDDGTEVDVHLDESFAVVATDHDGSDDD